MPHINDKPDGEFEVSTPIFRQKVSDISCGDWIIKESIRDPKFGLDIIEEVRKRRPTCVYMSSDILTVITQSR